MLGLLSKRLWIYRLKRKGLQLGSGCRIMGYPDFGSEPYLVSIGDHVTIGGKVTFITHDGGTWVFRDKPRYQGVIKYGRITVCDNCFIGFGATLLPGVTIGPNSVVGACSLVCKNVPPGTVAAGVPIRTVMTVEEYAERSLAKVPQYSRQAYKTDKSRELLRCFPKPW